MLTKLKLDDFIAEVASSSPAPGGGSVAAMSVASGAALISMLANLTKDKKGYEPFHQEMAKIAEQCTLMSSQLLQVIDKDTQAFDVFMDAMRLPKDTDQQKEIRQKAMQDAAKGAANVPLQLARDAFTLIKSAEYVIKNGNKNATSDGAVAMLMIRAGIIGALYNVRINLSSIKDEKFVADANKEADKIEKEVNELERGLLSNLTF